MHLWVEFANYKSNCDLSFAVVDNELKRSLANYKIGNNDVAGFSQHQSEELCIKEVAQQFSEKLIKELALIFNNQWNNGTEFLIEITAVPGKYVTKSSNIITNVYQVHSSDVKSYDNTKLSIGILYDGKIFELVDAINTAFFEAGINVNLANIEGNQVEFIWLGINE